MGTLTDQELGILQIHVEGGNVAAIGHWEKACDHLVELGYLRRIDKLNHQITPVGREVSRQQEDAAIGKMIEVGSAIGSIQKKIRDFAEQAAQLLVQASRASQDVTGDTPQEAAKKWSGIILRRALELIDG